MLTVPEVARRVGRDPETVRRWIRSGRLQARKVGTQHIVDEADLVAVYDQRETITPREWATISDGSPMPDVVRWLHRGRVAR